MRTPIGLPVIPLILLAMQSPAYGGSVLEVRAAGAALVAGATDGDRLGAASAAGDIDGDGEIELLIGAPGRPAEPGAPGAGAIYIFERSALEGLSLDEAVAESLASGMVTGNAGGDRFGAALAAADLDGDGIDDLIVGAPGSGSGARVASGAVYVIRGVSGRTPSGDVNFLSPAVLTGDGAGHRLGATVLAADVTGSGETLLLAAAFRGGADGRKGGIVYVVRPDTLWSLPGDVAVSEVAAARALGGKDGDALRGIAVADTDGDGGSEIILGAYHADGADGTRIDAGSVHVVPGEMLLSTRDIVLPDDATAVFTGAVARGFLGRSIAAGDIDGDGIDDLALPAYSSGADPNRQSAHGQLFIVFGPLPGPEPHVDLRTSDVPVIHGAGRWDLFGLPTILADLNGDKSDDIIAAAQFADPHDGKGGRGAVHVFWGSLRSVMAAKAGSAELADITLIGSEGRGAFGASLLAVDLAGDARLDLVIGAPEPPPDGDASGSGAFFIVDGAELAATPRR